MEQNFYREYEMVELPETNEIVGTGWLPRFPNLADYDENESEIKKVKQKLKMSNKDSVPTSVDLRTYCSPVENQGKLGSCTANASAGIVEYYERRAFNKHTDCSRLFIYKTTRNFMGVKGDTGAWLRTAMAALVHCGAPPEKYWKYTDKTPDFDEEPSSFIYSVADNFEALKYFSHDPYGQNVPSINTLKSVKKYLAAGIPSMFGFWGFPSFDKSNIPGGVPYPCPGEKAIWGHAVVAIGYDDDKKIKNTQCNKETVGALLIRNSWGTQWGEKGYGWIPYQYLLDKLALDFWSLLGIKWIDSGEFGL
ncbi:MAG TPA: C1 family peptidase [Nitrososphaeraceae archaeon]|jgi:C1A family cysteine protease|nr:C1 family peptidase [Nitrososphaeraceae archaeon]